MAYGYRYAKNWGKSAIAVSRAHRRRPTAYVKKKGYWKRRLYKRSQKGNFVNRNSQIAKLTWLGVYDADFAAAPGFNDMVLRLNSLYDPLYALGGGTPTGLSALQLMWQKYKVNAAKVSVKFVNTGTKPCRVGMYVCDDSMTTPATSVLVQARLVEMNNPTAILQPSTYGQGSTVTLKRFYRIKNIIGRDRSWDQNATSDVGTNPATQAHCHVVALADTGVAIPGATSTVRMYATIKFYSKFSANVLSSVD